MQLCEETKEVSVGRRLGQTTPVLTGERRKEEIHVCSATQPWPTLRDPMDCSQAPLPMGFFRQELLKWTAIFSSRESSGPRD